MADYNLTLTLNDEQQGALNDEGVRLNAKRPPDQKLGDMKAVVTLWIDAQTVAWRKKREARKKLEELLAGMTGGEATTLLEKLMRTATHDTMVAET